MTEPLIRVVSRSNINSEAISKSLAEVKTLLWVQMVSLVVTGAMTGRENVSTLCLDSLGKIHS